MEFAEQVWLRFQSLCKAEKALLGIAQLSEFAEKTLFLQAYKEVDGEQKGQACLDIVRETNDRLIDGTYYACQMCDCYPCECW